MGESSGEEKSAIEKKNQNDVPTTVIAICGIWNQFVTCSIAFDYAASLNKVYCLLEIMNANPNLTLFIVAVVMLSSSKNVYIEKTKDHTLSTFLNISASLTAQQSALLSLKHSNHLSTRNHSFFLRLAERYKRALHLSVEWKGKKLLF